MIFRVGTEELFKHRVQVILEPGLVLRTRQVTTRFVYVERRIPRDVRRDHTVEDFHQTIPVGLAPEVAGVAEAVHFVVVVVARRKVLPAVHNRGVGDAVPVLDAGCAELDVVPRVGLGDCRVMRRA